MLCDGGLMTKFINPKSLCLFACGKYNKDCLYDATDTTTIFDNKNRGISCDNLILKEHIHEGLSQKIIKQHNPYWKENLGLYQHELPESSQNQCLKSA